MHPRQSREPAAGPMRPPHTPSPIAQPSGGAGWPRYSPSHALWAFRSRGYPLGSSVLAVAVVENGWRKRPPSSSRTQQKWAATAAWTVSLTVMDENDILELLQL